MSSPELPMHIDHELLARELVRAIRGHRSQAALSRRLKYKTNMVYLWEAGRAWPTASKFFHAAERTGLDVRDAIARFYTTTPSWLSEVSPSSPEGVARLLEDLRGRTTLLDLAKSTGVNRFAVSRWLKGTTEPRLPQFLLMVDKCSQRLLDFVACIADPSQLQSIRKPWARLEAARRIAYEVPWSHAVLRALELQSYKELPAHHPGWIARRLGISLNEERRCLQLLAGAGQIQQRRGKWATRPGETVDTRRDPDKARELKGWWAQVGVDRILEGKERASAFNVFSVSAKDLERLRALQSAYYRELRNIVAQSEPEEHVVLCNLQLMALDE